MAEDVGGSGVAAVSLADRESEMRARNAELDAEADKVARAQILARAQGGGDSDEELEAELERMEMLDSAREEAEQSRSELAELTRGVDEETVGEGEADLAAFGLAPGVMEVRGLVDATLDTYTDREGYTAVERTLEAEITEESRKEIMRMRAASRGATPVSGSGQPTRPGSREPRRPQSSSEKIPPHESAPLKFYKKKARALEDEVEALKAKLEEKQHRRAGAAADQRASAEEKARLEKKVIALQTEVDKTRAEKDELRKRVEERTAQIVESRTELEHLRRVAGKDARAHAELHAKINRALADAERFKAMYDRMNEAAKEGRSAQDLELKRLKAYSAKLEKEREALVMAIKKQAQLIDVLKRQKIHVEVSRLLQFTEEEFVRVLEGPMAGTASG